MTFLRSHQDEKKRVYLWARCHVLCVVTGELSPEFNMALLEWFGTAA